MVIKRGRAEMTTPEIADALAWRVDRWVLVVALTVMVAILTVAA